MIVNVFHSALESAKRTTRLNITLEEINDFFATIDAINSLEWGAQNLNGRSLSEYRILDKLSFLILPAKVSVQPGRVYADLADKSKMIKLTDNNKTIMSPVLFNQLSVRIAAAMRIEVKEELVNNLRVDKVLADVYSQTATMVDGEMLLSGMSSINDCVFMPIVVSFPIYQDAYYSIDIQTHFETVFLAALTS